VGSLGVTVYGVLVAEYSFPGKEEEDHVFSHVQASFRGAMDQYVYGIVPGSSSTAGSNNGLEQQQQQRQQQQQQQQQQHQSASDTKQPGER
jgi:membrane protease subunit (stomatin/prohibitin family)